MPFGADPTIWIAGLAVIVIAVVVASWLLGRRRGRRGRRGTQSMGREESISYFRDFAGRAGAPGVHEEDDVGRWGGRDG